MRKALCSGGQRGRSSSRVPMMFPGALAGSDWPEWWARAGRISAPLPVKPSNRFTVSPTADQSSLRDVAFAGGVGAIDGLWCGFDTAVINGANTGAMPPEVMIGRWPLHDSFCSANHRAMCGQNPDRI